MPSASAPRALAALALLAGRLGVQGVRMPPGLDKAVPKTIAGVPVYNYHRAYEASGLLEVGEEEHRNIPVRWIIMLKDASTNDQVHQLCADAAGSCALRGHPSDGGIAFVQVNASEANLEGLLSRPAHQETVEFVEPDPPCHPIPEVPVLRTKARWDGSTPWGLEKIGAERGRGKGVHIYVLDSGIRTTHQEFEGRAIPTVEAINDRIKLCSGDTTCAADNDGHGTHCAGTTAGRTFGVATAATVHAVKVFKDMPDGKLEGYQSWTMTAMDWVTTKGQRPAVMSMSLGGKGTSSAYERAIQRAMKAGVTVVVAAGNEQDDACGYSPAFSPSAITVGAVDDRLRRASFSNYGSCVTLFAPGVDILSAGHSTDTGHRTLDGTSMATPHVAGMVAVLLERSPTATPEKIKSFLQATSEKNVVRDAMGSPDMFSFFGCPVGTRDIGDNFCTCNRGSCWEGKEQGCPGRRGVRVLDTFHKTCASCSCAMAPVPIESSRRWFSCDYANMHTCSDNKKYCCCDVGLAYDKKAEKCLSPLR